VINWAATNGHGDAIKLLLAKQADPKAKDKQGKLPIDLARSGKQQNVYDLLTGAK
jgi:ankyrin repeat protein